MSISSSMVNNSNKKKQFNIFETISKDIFDQDVTYFVSFDKSTLENSRIKQIFNEIQYLNSIIVYIPQRSKIQRRDNLILEYENIIKRLYNDQSVYDDKKNQVIREKQITRKLDRITYNGLARMGEVFAGQSSARYNWMISGQSNITAELTDWKMYQELARSSILLEGYSSGSGTIIKHGAAFSINDENYTVYEGGAVDFPAFNEDQTLWFRAVVNSGEQVEHEKGRDVVIISHAAFLVSVSDFEDQLELGNV